MWVLNRSGRRAQISRKVGVLGDTVGGERWVGVAVDRAAPVAQPLVERVIQWDHVA